MRQHLQAQDGMSVHTANSSLRLEDTPSPNINPKGLIILATTLLEDTNGQPKHAADASMSSCVKPSCCMGWQGHEP